MRRAYFFFLFLFLNLVLAQAETVSPYQLKAAFIFNFIKLVEWPSDAFESPSSPYVLGVLGKDPFGPALESTMRGKTINGRPILITQIDDTQITQCHVIFISNSEKKRLSEILIQIENQPVLTIGETEEFAERGGVMNFYVEDKKVRFEINIDAARRSNLKISSTLLNLAKIVRSDR